MNIYLSLPRYETELAEIVEKRSKAIKQMLAEIFKGNEINYADSMYEEKVDLMYLDLDCGYDCYMADDHTQAEMDRIPILHASSLKPIFKDKYPMIFESILNVKKDAQKVLQNVKFIYPMENINMIEKDLIYSLNDFEYTMTKEKYLDKEQAYQESRHKAAQVLLLSIRYNSLFLDELCMPRNLDSDRDATSMLELVEMIFTNTRNEKSKKQAQEILEYTVEYLHDSGIYDIEVLYKILLKETNFICKNHSYPGYAANDYLNKILSKIPQKGIETIRYKKPND